MASLSQRPPVSQPLTQLAANEGPLHKVAVTMLCIYLIVIVSRIHEVVTALGGVNLRLSLISLILCLVATAADGGLLRMFPSKISLVFVVLAWWVVLMVPVSIWRGGSVRVIQDYWITSVVSFFVVAAVPRTLAECRKVMSAMAFAFFLLLVCYAAYGSVVIEGRLGSDVPSLSNPNLFALQLLYVFPFCMLLGTTFSFLGLVRICGVFYGLLAIGRTGSRGAILAASLMFLVLLICASFFRKFLLIGFVAIVAVVVLATTSSSILDRYKELLFSDEESPMMASETVESAQQSSEARRRHLKESVVLTLKNPLFGVGPGMFLVASSDEKFTGGVRGAWKETHNTLTQFSSECGLPAAFLFLGILWYCLKTPISLYRLARRHEELAILAEMSFCVLLSVLGLLVTSMFASVAYQFYYPVLLGLVVALRRTADVEIGKVLQPAVARSPASFRKPARQPDPRPLRGPARLAPRRG